MLVVCWMCAVVSSASGALSSGVLEVDQGQDETKRTGVVDGPSERS